MSSGTSMWPGLTDPEHSKWYISRFRNKAEIGEDLAGEARLDDAMVERKSRILDAGCGTGRTGGYLTEQGHTGDGVDIDPQFIAAAREDCSEARWITGDLVLLDFAGEDERCHLAALCCGGRERSFSTSAFVGQALHRMVQHLVADGLMATGFGVQRRLALDDY